MMIKDGNLLKFEGLSGFDGLIHFTTLRHGGVSKGSYGSLNGSPFCGDCLEDVVENQRRILSHFSIRNLSIVLPFQEHGVKIVEVDEVMMALTDEERVNVLQGVDALITRVSNIFVAVSTADCVPILLYDPKVKGVGVVHAGWRGTVGFIGQRSIQRMIDEWGSDPSEIRVAIGPSISIDAFEVGDEVYQSFEENGFPMERIALRNPITGKWHIDLWEANVWQLEAIGVDRRNVELSEICTYKEHQDFFSARRLTIRSGRNLTAIGLI